MRQYKFRGKSMETGKWVFGYLVSGGLFGGNVDQCWIFFSDFRFHQVFPETVGRHTALTDKKLQDIYEGDMVKWDDGSGGKYWRVAVVEINPDIQFRIIENTIHPLSRDKDYVFKFGNFMYQDTHNHLEVIGNIFDNPEIIIP